MLQCVYPSDVCALDAAYTECMHRVCERTSKNKDVFDENHKGGSDTERLLRASHMSTARMANMARIANFS
jgi:hypothetical protein